jgi:hypothetical protein
VGAIRTLGAIAALIAVVAYFNFGTLSPCGVLRETVRQRDGLAAMLPDSLLDLAIVAQYGGVALSPGRCIEILINNQTSQATGRPQRQAAGQVAQLAPQVARPAPQAQPQPQAIAPQVARQQAPQAPLSSQDALRAAYKETLQAADECKAKRLSGELPTHLAAVRCANVRMIQAFGAAHYRYMDLMEAFAAKRIELATKMDRNELTENQANVVSTKFYASIVEAERRRDSAPR